MMVLFYGQFMMVFIIMVCLEDNNNAFCWTWVANISRRSTELNWILDYKHIYYYYYIYVTICVTVIVHYFFQDQFIYYYLWGMFTTCRVMSVVGSNIQPYIVVLPVTKGLMINYLSILYVFIRRQWVNS